MPTTDDICDYNVKIISLSLLHSIALDMFMFMSSEHFLDTVVLKKQINSTHYDPVCFYTL